MICLMPREIPLRTSPPPPLSQALTASALVTTGVNLGGFAASVVNENHQFVDLVGATGFAASALTTHALWCHR